MKPDKQPTKAQRIYLDAKIKALSDISVENKRLFNPSDFRYYPTTHHITASPSSFKICLPCITIVKII